MRALYALPLALAGCTSALSAGPHAPGPMEAAPLTPIVQAERLPTRPGDGHEARYALILSGPNKHAQNPLTGPTDQCTRQDIAAARGFFAQQGYAVRVLDSALGELPTNANIERAFAELATKADGDDAVALVFTGHGTGYRTGLLGVLGALRSAIHTTDGTLTDAELAALAKPVSYGSLFVAAETCYGGTLPSALAALQPEHRVAGYSAARADETSKRFGAGCNSTLTQLVFSAFAEPRADANADGSIDAREAFTYAVTQCPPILEDRQHSLFYQQGEPALRAPLPRQEMQGMSR